jgi:hypothetical protein
MKSYKELKEQIKNKKDTYSKKNKKSGHVEVMPVVNDGQKGIVTTTKNEEVLHEKSVSKSQQRFFGMVRKTQKEGEKKATSPEIARVASSIKMKDAKKFASTKHKGLPEKKIKKESFESGVLKARRYHRVGKLMSFKDFMKIMGDIMGEWEK